MAEFKELDMVALVRDRPDLKLGRGWVGALLLELAPGVWEVEFADKNWPIRGNPRRRSR